MSRFAELQHHVASMSELREIVGAMRSLAAIRVQEAQQALAGIRSYADTMAQAIGDVLLLQAPSPDTSAQLGRRALVLCVSEHGFVGGLNERLIDAAAGVLAAGDRLFVLGSRGAALLLERGREPSWQRPIATRVSGAPDTVNRLTNELYGQIGRGEISRVELMFTRYRQAAAPVIERRALLPFDPSALGALSQHSPPLHNLASHELLQRLVAEYVYAQLTEAMVESIASENAARFAAMESAHDNVSRKLVQLGQSVREARQDEITSELLDLLTGSSAV
jgi:F-type H+-transporting ATPase subunit gamma